MLRLSKKLLFAIEAVLDIAYNAGTLPVQSGEITRRQGIPRRYLEQVLQQLVRAGVLSGVRGPRGGYRLARERRRISLGEIVRVVRSLDPTPQRCGLTGPPRFPAWRRRPARGGCRRRTGPPRRSPLVARAAGGSSMTKLDLITIEDLCLRAQNVGVSGDYAARLDFSI